MSTLAPSWPPATWPPTDPTRPDAPGTDGEPSTSRRGARVRVAQMVLVGLLVAASGAQVTLMLSLTTASVVAIVVAPVWVAHLQRFRGAWTVAVSALVALGAGEVLARTSASHTFSAHEARALIVQVLTLVGSLGVLLWARSHLPRELVAVCYGVGLFVDGVLHLSGSSNAWKFELGQPATAVAVGALGLVGRPWLTATTLTGLALVGVWQDSRSYAGFAVLAAAVVLTQAWAAARRARAEAAGTTPPPRSVAFRVGLAAVGATATLALYKLATTLMLHGVFGAQIQTRTAVQVQMGGGSLIAGGRPELQASKALFADHPAGYGLGAIPDEHDVLVAKAGLSTVGINPQSGYVDRYMFGGHFELHSILADFWAQCGWFGIAFVVITAGILLAALVTSLADASAPAVGVYWSLWALWCVGFGPTYTNLPDLVFALGLLLLPVAGRAGARSSTSHLPGLTGPPGVTGTSSVQPWPAPAVSSTSTTAWR